MQFEESDWRSKSGMLSNLNLFPPCSAPRIFPAICPAAVKHVPGVLHDIDPTQPHCFFNLR